MTKLKSNWILVGYCTVWYVFFQVFAYARNLQIENADSLVRKADKIVVARISQVGTTGRHMFLSYPTLSEYPFEIYLSKVAVIEGLKNSNNGEIINMVFLKRQVTNDIQRAIISNPPNSLNLCVSPKIYLMFLRRTSDTNYFCAYTEPYDPVFSVFPLNVTSWTKDDMHKAQLPACLNRFSISTNWMESFRIYCHGQNGATNEISNPFVLPPGGIGSGVGTGNQ